MTKKQLAQKRNYFKFVLTGIPKPIGLDALTEYEQEEWATILNIRDELVDKFDNNSRIKGLNVPEHKCWCGKEAKYELEEALPDHGYFVCKKHYEN